LGVCDLASVKSGESRVLFLARHNDRSLLEMTRTRGASGFLLKSRPLTVVASAIQIVASGGDVFENHSQPTPPRIARPSQRELELLHALARGLTNAAIAHELEISARTVESHLRRMFARYLVASRAQLLILAMHEGWLA
jgi:DNA-binding NarL/FixJ family response regulator